MIAKATMPELGVLRGTLLRAIEMGRGLRTCPDLPADGCEVERARFPSSVVAIQRIVFGQQRNHLLADAPSAGHHAARRRTENLRVILDRPATCLAASS